MPTSPSEMVYVSSPYRGNFLKRLRNIRYARKASRLTFQAGRIPITPHLLYPQFLDERVEIWTKILGVLIEVCAELWAFCDNGITEGMIAEIEAFARAGKPVLFAKISDFQSPQ